MNSGSGLGKTNPSMLSAEHLGKRDALEKQEIVPILLPNYMRNVCTIRDNRRDFSVTLSPP